MANTTKLEMLFPYIQWDNWKHKTAMSIINMINGGRMKPYFKFSSFGNVSYEEDDVKKMHPIIEPHEKFNRMKSNVMIFDMPKNDTNEGYYDKMFMYHTNGVSISNYGFVLYNSETGKMTHKCYIDDTYDDLFQILGRVINFFIAKPWYDIYKQQYLEHNVNQSHIEALEKHMREKIWT